MTDDFAAVWDSFAQEVDARNRRRRKEVEAACSGIDALVQEASKMFSDRLLPDGLNPSVPEALKALDGKGSELLFEPVHAFRRARIQERFLSAMDGLQSDIEDVLRLLPKTIVLPPDELAERLSSKMTSLHRLIPGRRKKKKTFEVRASARAALHEYRNKRLEWDDRMSFLLARASLDLFFPWGVFRNEFLRSIQDARYIPRDIAGDRSRWMQRIERFRSKFSGLMEMYDGLDGRLKERLAAEILSDRGELSDRRRNRFQTLWQKRFADWSAMQRGVVAEIELEYASGDLLKTALGATAESLVSVDEEHAQILAELDRVQHWLGEWGPNKKMDPFPSPDARLVASEDRRKSWGRKISSAARRALPVHVEFVDVAHVFPGLRPSRKPLTPENSFVRSLEDAGWGAALAGFREAEEGHRAIIREIERAREVVAYGFEADDEDPEADLAVAGEGIQNAVSLLAYQKKSAADFHPVVERRLIEAIAATFLQFHVSVEENKLGLLKYLASQKGNRAFRKIAVSAGSRIKSGARFLWKKGTWLWDRILIAVGWSPPSTLSLEPVVRKDSLGDLLRLAVIPRELPALYKRLFRLAPVEDPRFLVGRDAEMAAVFQARQHWEEGRPVSILLAGARGSGKTSLLNCAHLAAFSDLEVVRGQFCTRVTGPLELSEFLASLMRTETSGLQGLLQSGKRVVILEETERTYLRKIGGFEALRTLLSLIASTSRNTLWILSLNQSALDYLENIVSFEENFSHRINAMAVAPEHLTEAILLRHNLSGLRLQLVNPEPENSRFDAIRRILGLERNVEQSYFDALYRQAEGVYRSAFELWLQSVDRVEGGVLHMMSPVQPDFDQMRSQLTLEDIFKLQAILQHGSLTLEELAEVLDEPVPKSGRNVDKLLAWDLLEEDPSGPGFRIKPAAGRFVRSALFRQNLL
jgi:hypothetical protein